MLFKLSRLAIIIFVLASCQEHHSKNQAEGQRISIDYSLEKDTVIDNFIAPFRSRIEASMNQVLSYSTGKYSKTNGELNTAVGNLMADAVFERISPVLKQRYNLDLDIVLLNHGGIRAPLPQGPILMKTPFNIMPFENKVVVTQMRGDAIINMTRYLAKVQRAHPISGMTLEISKLGKISLFEIQNKPFDSQKIYNVATSDYLYKGGDRMDFFQSSDTVFDMNYKIRNVLIDYFQSKDTLNPKQDNRFTYSN